MPDIVMVDPPDVAMLLTIIPDSTGDSYVNVFKPVPITAPSVTVELLAQGFNTPVSHVTFVSVNHAEVRHRPPPNTLLTLMSSIPKFKP
jgi:hypothetical protein